MALDLILGTAGHIDHGKTSLVKALTGVDTDRLPEEKLRGITIELGFAQLDLGDIRLGIVDVPGHERFVRNMLAGATGVDIALLVVAADDSVKPQTREHLEILRLLELEVGVIALSKCDLPDPAWLELVQEEVRDLVAGTFLAHAPIIRTSVTTGQGLDDLRRALATAARQAAGSPRTRRLEAPFRMAIDRSFTLAGHGTVVTGSVASGRVRVGDELVVQPGQIQVRVRGLQNHDRAADEVHRGQRAAINLAGIHHEQVHRGQELSAVGHLVPSKVITVRLSVLPSMPRPLKHRSRVRCHLGTAELMASVSLLGAERLEPGATGPAQLFLAEPCAVIWGQPFVLRTESPVQTLGGGQVVDPHAARLPRRSSAVLAKVAELSSHEPLARAGAALYFAGLRGWQPEELTRTAGINDLPAVLAELERSGDLCQLQVSHSRHVRVHRQALDEIYDRIRQFLDKEHARNPLRAMLDRSRLANQFTYLGSDGLVEAVLAAMGQSGQLRMNERGVALPGRGPQLSQNEQRLVGQILDSYRAAGYQPPTVGEIKAQAVKNQAAVPQLITLAAAEGQLVQISPDFYLHADVDRQLRDTLAPRLAEGGLTVSQIRDILAISRKYAVPICEYLDRCGFTRRDGDLRVLASSATPP